MKKQIKKGIKVFIIFLIGSIIGYGVEMIVGLVQNGHLVSRQGLLYGPFIPVYGMGMVVYYLFLKNREKDHWAKIFIVSMIIGGIVEFAFSYFQEKCFGTVSWDYSHLWFNIQGRTSLLHCTYWGIAGIIFVKKVLPYLNKIDPWIENVQIKYVASMLLIFMIFNVSVSCMAANRQEERRQNLRASHKVDQLLDEIYPDTVMNRIYSNKIDKVVNLR